jgi:hypothetical protein
MAEAAHAVKPVWPAFFRNCLLETERIRIALSCVEKRKRMAAL